MLSTLPLSRRKSPNDIELCRLTSKPTLYSLSSDALCTVITGFLNRPETANLLSTCHYFETALSTKQIWENFYKLQYPHWTTDRFHCLVPSTNLARVAQEKIYRQLYGLRAQSVQKLWNLKDTIPKASRPLGLSNSNIAIHRSCYFHLTIWSPHGAHVEVPCSCADYEYVEFKAALPGGGMVEATRERSIRIWSSTGQLIKAFTEKHSCLRNLTVSPNGTIIIVGYDDSTVRALSPSGVLLRTYAGHKKDITRVLGLKNGNIASLDCSGTVHIWSPEDLNIRHTFSHPNFNCVISEIRALPNGGILTVSRSSDPYKHSKIDIWTSDGKPIRTKIENGNYTFLSALSNGIILAMYQDLKYNIKIQMWSSDGNSYYELKEIFNDLICIKPLPDEGFVTVSRDYKICIWSSGGKIVETLDYGGGGMQSFDVMPNGDIVMVSGREGEQEREMRIWTRDVKLMMHAHIEALRSANRSIFQRLITRLF